MTTLETCLFQLLLKHDCVVVPNFGGFVAKHSSAKILANGTILPPSKHFTLNKLLKQIVAQGYKPDSFKPLSEKSNTNINSKTDITNNLKDCSNK